MPQEVVVVEQETLKRLGRVRDKGGINFVEKTSPHHPAAPFVSRLSHQGRHESQVQPTARVSEVGREVVAWE